MDSFCSLFDPSDGAQGKQKKKNPEQDNVKKKQDAFKTGRRRGRKSHGKGESLPEESSFLCEPHLSSEVLMKDTSYIENYIQINKDEDTKTDDKKPKRRNSGRKGRRRKNKVSPGKELTPTNAWTEDRADDGAEITWNNTTAPRNSETSDIGRNVNNLRGDSASDVTAIEPAVNRDTYIGGLSMAELEREFLCSSDDGEDLSDDSSSSEEARAGAGGARECYGRLPPEPRFGNVEYKLRLAGGSGGGGGGGGGAGAARRFDHLVTQLKWRLASGGGACVYVVGVRDCGAVCGAGARSLRRSLRTLRRMCSALGARPARLAVRALAPRRAVAEALVRLPPAPPTATLGALRLAALGAAGAGKSTLVGVLTHGELDSGAGSARLNVFRHLHEVRSGRTSSLSHEILGFDEEGNVVNYGCAELMTAARIGERSAKLVSFLDLAGHAKYQRTTLHGLAGYAPHYAMIVISSTGGIGPMTEEHLSLALALRLPFFVVLSKADRAPAAAAALLRRLALLLAPAALKPILITNENMAREFASPQKLILDTMDTLNGEQNCQQNNHDRSSGCSELSPVAVFPVSCVRGSGLGPLHAYLLGLQPPRAQWAQLGPGLSGPPEGTADDDESCEFQIDEVFRMEEGSGSGGSEGPVVCGLVVRGELREGAEVLVGPRADGRFGRAAVRTVHAHRVPRASARAGHCVGVALDRRARALRPGMVLLSIPKDYKHDEHSRPVFGACPPGQCPYSHELVTKLMNDNQNDKLKNRKNVRRKNMNLLQDIAAVETSLAKESSGVDKNNIYNRSDSEGEGKTVDDEEEEGAKGAESRCPCGVPLDDPRDPRGALYFQAWVQVLRQPTAVRAGYQCVVHSGGVTQTALVQGVLTARGALRSGEAGSVVLRFVRGPEYLVRGRRALFTAGLGTWAIGHITQVFPYIP